ncbi:hypothetical protein AAHC03_05352 [Spirometra sp. Aus1]
MAVYMDKSKSLVPSMDTSHYPILSISTTEGEQDWSESIWSLGSGSMDHEYSDRSNAVESKVSDTGVIQLMNEPTEENLSSYNAVPPSQSHIVQMRKKHTDMGSPRRIGQKQMSLEERNLSAFCGHPQISGSRISDPSADEKVQRPFFGLDCYELFRRNSMPVRLKTRPNLQELPKTQRERRPESWQHGMTVSSSIDRARLNLLRTSSEDRPSQPSPDIWRTKPPRPPPLSNQGTESVPVGRVAEIVNRVENLLLQSEGNDRLTSGSRSAAVASTDRDRDPTRQQSAAHPTASDGHNTQTLTNKRPLLTEKTRVEPSESSPDLIPVGGSPPTSAHGELRKASSVSEPPTVTDHRRRGTPSATIMQLRQGQVPYSGQRGRGEGYRRHTSIAQPCELFFARMTSQQAGREGWNRKSSDTTVVRTSFSPQFSTRNNFENLSINSEELEKKKITEKFLDGEGIRQQAKTPVLEGPLQVTKNSQTEKYSSSKVWFPESDSKYCVDLKLPDFPSLSSVLSAGSQATATSFSSPPTHLPPPLSPSLQRTYVPASRFDPMTRMTVAQPRRINRALTLPATTNNRQRTPSPPRLLDDSTSTSDSSEHYSCPSHVSSISLFELLQFCHLEAVLISGSLVSVGRRPAWWADDPITCLGLRVTSVQLLLPESWDLKRIPIYHAPPAGNVQAMPTHPSSAFKPVTPRHSSRKPSVLLIEEVYKGFPTDALPELQVGQILVELNGVNLLSTVNHMDRLRLFRVTLLNAFRALDAGRFRGLALTVATPSKSVSRSARGDLVINDVSKQPTMLPKVPAISIYSQPPSVPPRRVQQDRERLENPETEFTSQNLASASLRKANSFSSCSSCSSTEDRILFGRSHR